MTDLPIVIREVRESDMAFVKDSWVNTIRYKTPAFFWVPNKVCKTSYRRMIEELLTGRPDLFRMLVNEEDEDQIIAWICGDKRVTHFVYVKEKFRDMGLASLLIDVNRKTKGWVFSHWTKDCERIGRIDYRPSLFQEVLRGLNKAEASSIAKADDDLRSHDTDNHVGRERDSRDLTA
jgi:hypothetical protein